MNMPNVYDVIYSSVLNYFTIHY